jgi:hypothetical protein
MSHFYVLKSTVVRTRSLVQIQSVPLFCEAFIASVFFCLSREVVAAVAHSEWAWSFRKGALVSVYLLYIVQLTNNCVIYVAVLSTRLCAALMPQKKKEVKSTLAGFVPGIRTSV